MGAIKLKGLNRIAKIGQDRLFRERSTFALINYGELGNYNKSNLL